MQLGKKIRSLRFRRGLTVQQLAEASGLSKGFISQVENDRTSPSLATLRDLARALDTSVAFLVVEEDQTPYVVRESDRPRFHFGSGASRVEILSAQPKRNIEVLMAELAPGVSTIGERHSHHGEECVVCLGGQVTVTCGEHTLVLEAGDSCHYDGRAPHSIENTGAANARVLIATSQATLEPSIQVRHRASETNGTVVEVSTIV
jgi:transcriptional regulator with XRE-family HTH domain